MEAFSEMRAYVGGEGHWSKGQKDAVDHLLRDVTSRDECDDQLFRDSLEVPLGDRRARLEMAKPVFDEAVVREGLVQGGNDLGDVPGTIRL